MTRRRDAWQAAWQDAGKTLATLRKHGWQRIPLHEAPEGGPFRRWWHPKYCGGRPVTAASALNVIEATKKSGGKRRGIVNHDLREVEQFEGPERG
jgi:hypothetical protein